MGQQTLIYSFVARGTIILAEYSEFTGNFNSIASQCLQKLPTSNNKFSYNCDGHTFNFLSDNGFTYCVVATESAGREIPIAFLDRVKDDFSKRYAGGKAATASAKSLNREFGSKLKEHMKYCVDHPEEISKLSKVKAQVSEVKGVMMENIEKVLDRGEKIELLVDKTENLRSQVSLMHQEYVLSNFNCMIDVSTFLFHSFNFYKQKLFPGLCNGCNLLFAIFRLRTSENRGPR
ncbi:putative vesicle-associated membrane protein 726 isoform X1 [Nicotiana tabacum]|uniref:Vesicle-associated membrane protein 726 isoform X1 n=1 Tax=Nicotiana tabacum TaxID=4097 RepID=A0A1S3XJE0_TOBAC|nr:PREDICTED: putative vesicle-associated membrane protein 726 isoform X1 [Nicotiana tabacum]